ncbi:DNA-directed DNA/RNA polymerase mu-like [Sycon ciliatum]|uniref:DNA-directed DNA/RNA polymerase mu-like n=1 Tax=Sycon ciliatum TaxID=27933 RepID=UPI0031F6B78A
MTGEDNEAGTSQDDSHAFEDTNYACLSATPLKAVNPDNQRFVDALLALEKAREILDYNSEARGSRSLAFRRAACKLKIYPKSITSAKQVANLDAIGRHSLQVVEDILKDGYSQEVKDYENNARLQVLKTFSSVYGCGPASAAKWYGAGARTIKDIRDDCASLSDRQKVGLEYHDYLQVPVAQEEAEALRSLIEEEVQSLSTGMTATLAGGFRRGKPSGHDIDVLLHHANDDYETDFLQTLTEKLQRKGLLVHSELFIGKNTSNQLEKSVASHYHRDTTFYQRTQKMDHLDKAYCMLDITDNLLSRYVTASDAAVTTTTTTTTTGHASTITAICATSAEGRSADRQPSQEKGEAGIQAASKPSPVIPTAAADDDDHLAAKDGSLPDGEMRWWTKRKHFVRRVDLIVCPHKQWAYALVGWTGSKYFNRALRLYAVREKQTILNSQTMYNQTTQQFIPAATEEDVFRQLGVPVFPPHLRNC